MQNAYSIYDAKARLSELLRYVKQGRDMIITERGKPIAKLTPYREAETFADRIAELEASGQLRRGTGKGFFRGVVSRPGALKRFLEDRD